MKAKRRNWLRKREEKLNFPVKRKGNAYSTETVLLSGNNSGESSLLETKSLLNLSGLLLHSKSFMILRYAI